MNIVGSEASKQQLSVRAYLDQTVVPVLLQAMSALVKARPEDEDPAVFLAKWILENQQKSPIDPVPKESERPVTPESTKEEEEEENGKGDSPNDKGEDEGGEEAKDE